MGLGSAKLEDKETESGIFCRSKCRSPHGGRKGRTPEESEETLKNAFVEAYTDLELSGGGSTMNRSNTHVIGSSSALTIIYGKGQR